VRETASGNFAANVQVPTAKLQRSLNLQCSNKDQPKRLQAGMFGISLEIGIWVFGAFCGRLKPS
jgi:hypothetical protein